MTEAYEEHEKPQEDGLMKVYERYMKENGNPKSMADIGTYLHMIKDAEPRFTGRAIKNVTDAIKMRAMEIDRPDEWFEKPEAFMHKGYDDKKAMIEELRTVFACHGQCGRSTATPILVPLFRQTDDAAVEKLRDAPANGRPAKWRDEKEGL